ncbi:MAG: hypothetical protein Q7T39_22080 [Polaromonas sp.]|nr:hypothetical protein [Polaromonas sp.]
MWLRFVFLAVAAMAIGYVKTGDLSLTTKVVAWLSPIFLLASYFLFRQGTVATRGERLVAYGWLSVRRLLCFTGAALFFAAAVTTVVVGPFEMDKLIGVVGLGALSVFLTWVGIYGEGRDSHRKRMARYEESKEVHDEQ